MKYKIIFTAFLLCLTSLLKAQRGPKRYGELFIVYQNLDNKQNPFQVKIKACISNQVNTINKTIPDSSMVTKIESYSNLSDALTYLSSEKWEVQSVGNVGNTVRVIIYKVNNVKE